MEGERRAGARWSPPVDGPGPSVRLRSGDALTVVNMSRIGVLVASATRLAPGVRIGVHVVTREGRLLIRASVVRCSVTSVAADHIEFHGALAFEDTVEW